MKNLSWMIPFLWMSFTASAQTATVSDPFVKVRQLTYTQKSPDALKEVDVLIGQLKDPIQMNMALFVKSKLLIELGRGAEAEPILITLIQAQTNLIEYHRFYLALAYLKQNKNDLAKAEFNKVLDSKPNFRLKADSQFHLAVILNDEKNHKQAKAQLVSLEKRSRSETTYPDIIFELARAELGLKNRGPFCKWVSKLYSKHPGYDKIENWGLDLAKATFLEKPTGCFASNEEQRLRIKNLQWSGMSEEAQKEIKELYAQTAKEDKFEADKLQAQFLIHEGLVEEALKVLLPYYATKKNNYSYLLLVGSASARAGDAQTAVGSYYSAYKLSPGSKTARTALFQSAMLSYQFQDYDGASRKFKEFQKRYSGSSFSNDIKWNLAWIQYLKGDYESSFKSFSQLKSVRSRGKKRGFSTERAQYWMAMSLYRQGKDDKARVIFESLSKDKLLGYYSVVSKYRRDLIDLKNSKALSQSNLPETQSSLPTLQNRYSRFIASEFLMPSIDEVGNYSDNIENEEVMSLTLEDEEEATEEAADPSEIAESEGALDSSTQQNAEAIQESQFAFSSPMLMKRFEQARDLTIMGAQDLAKWDLFEIEKSTRNKDYLKQLISEYETVDTYNRSSYIGQVYFGSQRAFHGIEGIRHMWESTYPKAYSNYVEKYTKDFSIPVELVWGIMRAESNYKKDVRSPVGALGLMQVMPLTGRKMSESLGEKSFNPENLTQPETAVKIGSRYLQRMMKNFDNSVPLTAASYNAGPHRVYSWLKSFGHLDMDEFVEHIPFLETRNYVKKVVSNYHIYSQLYSTQKDTLKYVVQPINVKLPDPIPTREIWEDI